MPMGSGSLVFKFQYTPHEIDADGPFKLSCIDRVRGKIINKDIRYLLGVYGASHHSAGVSGYPVSRHRHAVCCRWCCRVYCTYRRFLFTFFFLFFFFHFGAWGPFFTVHWWTHSTRGIKFFILNSVLHSRVFFSKIHGTMWFSSANVRRKISVASSVFLKKINVNYHHSLSGFTPFSFRLLQTFTLPHHHFENKIFYSSIIFVYWLSKFIMKFVVFL